MELSIITINFNTGPITIDCIKSVLKNTKGVKFEIIVVDNNSKDDSLKLIKKEFGKNNHVRFVANKKNLGFSEGNNSGAKVAKGKILLFLNSDTIVRDNAIGEMVIWMSKHPQAGAATCALKNKDGTLQSTGGYFPTTTRVFAWMFFLDDLPILRDVLKPFHPHIPEFLGDDTYKKQQRLDWITGAFFLTPKALFEKLGGFDKDYFMYAEDTDLSYRIYKKGYKIWYLPHWSIVHLGGSSGTSENTAVSEFKNILLYHKKHGSKLSVTLVRSFLKIGALLRIVVFPSKYQIYKNVYKAI